VLNYVPRNQGMYGSVGLAPRILDLGTIFPLCWLPTEHRFCYWSGHPDGPGPLLGAHRATRGAPFGAAVQNMQSLTSTPPDACTFDLTLTSPHNRNKDDVSEEAVGPRR
jgi:hypothetical protein